MCVFRVSRVSFARAFCAKPYAVQSDSRVVWVEKGVLYAWRAVYITHGIKLVICVIVCLFVCVLCHSVYITYS